MEKVRKLRLEELIKQHIMSMLARGDIKDPRVHWDINITRVQVAEDASIAKVYISSHKSDQSVQKACDGLNHAQGFIRSQLGVVLKTRNTPKPLFYVDEQMKVAYRIHELLDSLDDTNV
jgi:ribosome-binding factor A